MRRSSLYCLLVVWITVLCLGLEAKDTKRSKRQLSVFYVCGNAPNTFVSQNPCQYQSNGCGQPSCNNFQSNAIIPRSFYSAGSNCQNSCNNFNCNNYNGQFLNGQYVAYQYGTNQYSPCASNCCRFQPQPIMFQPTLHDPFSHFNWRLPRPAIPVGPGPVIPPTPSELPLGIPDGIPSTFSTDLYNPYSDRQTALTNAEAGLGGWIGGGK